jgi:hypothetical protein
LVKVNAGTYAAMAAVAVHATSSKLLLVNLLPEA